MTLPPVSIWATQWLLLTAGEYAAGKYNSMTVGWGSLGVMWGKPFAQIVVRPSRYTLEFIGRHETFTLCAFPAKYRDALMHLGTKSGRDEDKIAAAGLTPEASTCVAAPSFAEAELAIECRKIYWDNFKPANFLDPDIGKNYPLKDYHRVFYGEILAVSAAPGYRA